MIPAEPECDSNHAVNTPDITLTYVRWLDRARQNPWLQLYCDVRALYAMALWDFGEDGSCYHHYHSQHEAVDKEYHLYPASRDGSTHYFEESAIPQHRPPELSFSKHHFNYPLAHTRQIGACSLCSGSGQVKCGGCGGKGRCSHCRGSGRIGSHRCSFCSGTKKCSKCKGTGQVMCGTCHGEGVVLSYTSHNYSWWHDSDEETIFRPGDEKLRLKGLVFKARRQGGSVQLTEFSQAEIMRTTGVYNNRIQELLQSAEGKRRKLEAKIQGRSARILFQEIRRAYVPLLYINLFAGRKYGQCFAAGTQEVQAVHFPLPLSLVKCGAWAALAAFVGLLACGTALPFLLAINFLLLAGLGGVATHQSLQRSVFMRPERWIIFDDHANGAWQFAYLYAQAISQNRVARITDPWFTTLLEPPTVDSVQGRNSFLYTIEALPPSHSTFHGLNPYDEAAGSSAQVVQDLAEIALKEPAARQEQTGSKGALRKIEFLVIGQRAQHQFSADVHALAANANRIILLSHSETVEALSKRITALLAVQSSQERAPLRLTVVTDSERVKEKSQLTMADLLFLTSKTEGVTFDIMTLPLARMCEEARMGSLSQAGAAGYRQLLAFGGYSLNKYSKEYSDQNSDQNANENSDQNANENLNDTLDQKQRENQNLMSGEIKNESWNPAVNSNTLDPDISTHLRTSPDILVKPTLRVDPTLNMTSFVLSREDNARETLVEETNGR